jgi:hypothetical protein
MMDTTEIVADVPTRLWDKKADELTVKDNLVIGAAAIAVTTVICVAPYVVMGVVVGIKEARARRKEEKAKALELEKFEQEAHASMN